MWSDTIKAGLLGGLGAQGGDGVGGRLLFAALLRSAGIRQSCSLPSLNHYLLIHFTQPGVIMHGPVNGYLSMRAFI